MREQPGLSHDMARFHGSTAGRQRSLSQAALFNTNMLSGLERLVRVSKDLPGRKILFFLSNGFQQNRRGDTDTRLKRMHLCRSQERSLLFTTIDTRGLTLPNRI